MPETEFGLLRGNYTFENVIEYQNYTFKNVIEYHRKWEHWFWFNTKERTKHTLTDLSAQVLVENG
jgi:hypothetical protein